MAEQYKLYARQNGRTYRVPLYKKNCPYCGNSFFGQVKQICCSRACANRYKWSDPDYKARVVPKLLALGPKAREKYSFIRKAFHLRENKWQPSMADWRLYQKKMTERWREFKGKRDPVKAGKIIKRPEKSTLAEFILRQKESVQVG